MLVGSRVRHLLRSHVGYLLGSLVGHLLRSLVRSLVGFHVSCLTLIDSFHSGLLVGCLVDVPVGSLLGSLVGVWGPHRITHWSPCRMTYWSTPWSACWITCQISPEHSNEYSDDDSDKEFNFCPLKFCLHTVTWKCPHTSVGILPSNQSICCTCHNHLKLNNYPNHPQPSRNETQRLIVPRL